MKVKNCKLKKAITCLEEDTIEKIARKLKDKKEKIILVVSKKNKNKIVGVISFTDLVYKVIAKSKDTKKTKAKDVMTSQVYVASSEDSITKVYFDMVARNIFYCPVLSKGKIKGILTVNEAFNRIVKIAKNKLKK